jgi:hypothetical protein
MRITRGAHGLDRPGDGRTETRGRPSFFAVNEAAIFEGEFSNVTRSYAGKGVVRYAW